MAYFYILLLTGHIGIIVFVSQYMYSASNTLNANIVSILIQNGFFLWFLTHFYWFSHWSDIVNLRIISFGAKYFLTEEDLLAIECHFKVLNILNSLSAGNGS